MAQPKIDPNYMLLGRVLRPHGVRGEMRVEVITEMPQYFEAEELHLGRKTSELTSHAVVGVRFHKGQALLSLADIGDREAAEALRGLLVYLAREYVPPLEEGEFYLHELIGMRVITDEGEVLGTVVDTIQTGANDVIVVRGERGELLIPDTEEVVTAVDRTTQMITVHPIPGLF